MRNAERSTQDLPWRPGTADRRGYTLVELLVAVAIMALLLAVLLPALKSVHDESRAFVCMDNLRTVALDFRLFADGYAHGNRGDSNAIAPRFSAVDFLESQYRVAEFWDNSANVGTEDGIYRRGSTAMICRAVPLGLRRKNGTQPLGRGSVAPASLISYALNRRLRFAPFKFGGSQTARLIELDERILDHPNVPLVFDADPTLIQTNDRSSDWPFYAAPPGRSPSIYDATHKFWFPALRHRGRMSISFVGGHVLSTNDPTRDPSWDWDYYPPLRL